MQTRSVSNKRILKQGTIFSIKNIKFASTDKKKKLKFSDIYPEVKLQNITYGIILSQSCDLVRRDKAPFLKTPYILTALLEPIEKFIEQKYSLQIDELLNKYSLSHSKYTFIDMENLKKHLYRDCYRLFGNRETFYFFVSLGTGKKQRMFYVNLVKCFPFKIMHYDTFTQNAKYELKPDFANKLGYMLSYIYGRVGIPDYTREQVNNLTELMTKKLITKLKKQYRGTSIYEFLKPEQFDDFRRKLESSKQSKIDDIINQYIKNITR